jgi:hypothetical protein
MTDSQAPTGVIESPDGAAFAVEQNMLDGGDSSSCLAVTIHERDGQSHGNFWQCSFGQWSRVIPEWVIEQPAHPDMLTGVLYQIAGKYPALVRQIDSDLRLRMCFTALVIRAEDAASTAR